MRCLIDEERIMIKRLQDWWRGWSDSDLVSILEKVEQHRSSPPGSVIFVSQRELRAHVACLKEAYPLMVVRS